MKMAFITWLILQLLLAPDAIGAEQMHVSLPDIQGRYYVDMSIPAVYYGRAVHFQLDRIPIAVDRVWIHISGTFSVGEIMCDLEGDGTPEGPYAQGLEYAAEMKDTVNGSWFVAGIDSPLESGAFEYTLEFKKLFGDVISWDFLRTSYGNISMSANFGMFPECWVTIWPEATIETAELIIEGEFLVSVQESTWGSIKSLFR